MKSLKRKLWAIVVAYMLGMHNFYKGEDKTPDDIGKVVDHTEIQTDASPGISNDKT